MRPLLRILGAWFALRVLAFVSLGRRTIALIPTRAGLRCKQGVLHKSRFFKSHCSFVSLNAYANDEQSFEASRKGLNHIVEQAKRNALIQSKLGISDDLVSLEWLGATALPTTDKSVNQTCLVLGQSSTATSSSSSVDPSSLPRAGLVLPLEKESSLRLLKAAQDGQPLSPPVLLRMNTVAVNRDNAMFDNLPWAAWTIDPVGRNRDAAGNFIDAKYHLGKRDAYNVMLGKDWGRLSLLEELQKRKKDNDSNKNNSQDDEDENTLARRVLELQLREARMDLAECDYQIAVASTMDQAWELEDQREVLVGHVTALESELDEMIQSNSNLVDRVLGEWVERQKSVEPVEAPYRGATGYAPKKANESTDDGPFSSPYDMFRSILKDQLKAEVIGVLLENTSLLEGSTALGGLLVLQRITAVKSTTILGETLTASDETQDYGNTGILGGEVVIVECDADEALGMSLACNIPLQLEHGLWERTSLMLQPSKHRGIQPSSLKLEEWETLDPELSILLEGQASNQSATERVAPLRLARSSTSLWEAIRNPVAPSTSTDLFPTDNPIQSLSELDALSNEDKARTLLGLSNFDGKLPRPRRVRESEQSDAKMNVLDRLLIPLVDESVRREYYIRQAIQEGDLELAQELESSKSMRQIAKEKAARARDTGDLEVAEYWEKEAEFYASLRADVTQDEGAYSRFLDSDEWYERERRKTAARVDRKKFGNLLDGIE